MIANHKYIALVFIGLHAVNVIVAADAQSSDSCEYFDTPLINCPSDCFSSYGITDGGWWYDVMEHDSGRETQNITSGGCKESDETHILQKSVDCMKSDGTQRIRHEACHCWKCR